MNSGNTDHPDTPKTENKRRFVSLANEERPGSPRRSNSFDCHSLQRSLKRVRLSRVISPGELRLQRDLRHAVLSSGWTVLSEDAWRVDPTVTVQRKQDPLTLTVQIETHPQRSGIVIQLTFPRLYPHRPPVCQVVQQPQHASASPMTSAISNLVIANSPDDPVVAVAHACPGTVLWTDWSPLCRLTDILAWLAKAVREPRAFGPVATNDSFPGSSSSNHQRASPLAHSNIHGYHMMMEGSNSDRKAAVPDEERMEWEEKKGDDEEEHDSPRTPNSPRTFREADRATEKPATEFFPINRFDVGYERSHAMET